jgi:DNA-binding NtrC family response regulator
MKSIRVARIVVVADSDQGQILAARLRRMDVAKVTAVAGLEEARQLCQLGDADACLVAIDAPIPDGIPVAETEAPGRCCGVPTLIMVPVVTPYLRRSARRCGYLAAVPATIRPRMLYRRLGAALQHRRHARARSRRLPPELPLVLRPDAAAFGKPTLH